MANLTTRKWERYWPALGNNRELPEGERLELEVATGLTAQQVAEVSGFMANASTEQVEALTGALEPYVRVRGGPHSIDGVEVKTLGDYLKVVSQLADISHVLEVATSVIRANTLSRDEEVFAARQSGGWVSTQRRAAAQADGPTAGR